MSYSLISTPDLDACVSALSPGYVLLADCEFVRERTFWPKLGLLQARVGDRILLIDSLMDDNAEAVTALFSKAALTVMHSPSEDLECLQHSYGWLPGRLFDTQLAAAFCGLGAGLSYRALVEEFAQVLLDKAETRSDWLARPLSAAQLNYAADDVLHLQTVFQALEERLDQRGRRDWFEQDCAAALRRAEQAAQAPPGVVLDPRTTQRLDPLSVARLQCILDWRELEARRLDRPRSWIIDNESSHQLASAPHGDQDAHRRALNGAKHLTKHAPAALWDALDAIDTAGLSTRAPLGRSDNSRYKQQLAQLQREVAAVAKEHELPPGLLMPRKHLETLIDSGQWPEAASGWREALLRPRLAQWVDINSSV